MRKLNQKTLPVIAGGVLAIIVVAAGVFFFVKAKPGPENNQVATSIAEVEARVMKYLEENVSGATASIVSTIEKDGLYEMVLKIDDQEFTSYASKNGQLLFPQAIDLDEFFLSLEAPEITTRDVPDVKLFVMSYCPYGLQAQKGLVPAWDLLKERAEIGIYFVDYIMHGREEIDENLRQYCIGQEEPEKLIAYLFCFTQAGETETCLYAVQVDRAGLSACVAKADNDFNVSANYEDEASWLSERYPLFELHGGLNEKYQVSGSPTLVINDSVISLKDRSPEGFKTAICQAFTNPPEECLRALSQESPSPGFGAGTGGSSGGSCE